MLMVQCNNPCKAPLGIMYAVEWGVQAPPPGFVVHAIVAYNISGLFNSKAHVKFRNI